MHPALQTFWHRRQLPQGSGTIRIQNIEALEKMPCRAPRLFVPSTRGRKSVDTIRPKLLKRSSRVSINPLPARKSSTVRIRMAYQR
jgi:hypothetical protein